MSTLLHIPFILKYNVHFLYSMQEERCTHVHKHALYYGTCTCTFDIHFSTIIHFNVLKNTFICSFCIKTKLNVVSRSSSSYSSWIPLVCKKLAGGEQVFVKDHDNLIRPVFTKPIITIQCTCIYIYF